MKKQFAAAFVVLMMATAAMAQRGGPPPQGGGDHGPRGGDGGPGGGLLVAADGTVFLTQMTVDTAANTSSTKITAVRSTGTIAWTATIANLRGPLFLSGSNLIYSSSTTATDGAVSTTLTALSTASGQQAWTRTLAGRVSHLEAFSGGTYAIVTVPPTTTGGTATRSLIAISSTGTVLFTVPIT